MLQRICDVCGRIVPVRTTCKCKVKREQERQRNYDKSRRSKERADFYRSSSWANLSKYIKAKAGYKDELVAYDTGRLIEARIVHHIIPLVERPDLAMRADNLILVSDRTHKRIHDVYETDGKDELIAKLQQIARRREGRSRKFWLIL